MASRSNLLALLVATALFTPACDSQLKAIGTPARTPVDVASARAVLAPGAGGQTVTIDNPSALPEVVRNAADLKVAFGATTVPVTRSPGGSLVFVIPATARTTLDVAGNLRVIFVINERDSAIVTLGTGSPVQFATPPVLAEPVGGTIVRGLDVKLTANTAADTAAYQFTWAFSTTGTAPWQPIPGQGKNVTWTPPAPGNYFIKVDAIDKVTQQAFATTTPSAVVFVTDGKETISTEPPSGSVDRGRNLNLVFNQPPGLVGTDFGYTWSAAPSPQGPWTPIAGEGPKVSWLPTGVGSFHVRTEVSNRTTGSINTFISPNAVVFVNEGKPIVTALPQSVQRGARVDLKLNIATANGGPYTWFYSRGSGPAAIWTPLSGQSDSIPFVPTDPGVYNFRVDVPDPSGTIKTFTTTEPVLTVAESTPVITANKQGVDRGDPVSLQLNIPNPGSGPFTWYYSKTPTSGWTTLPGNAANIDFVTTETGSYFFRVDVPNVGGVQGGQGLKTFTSTDPVLSVSERSPLFATNTSGDVITAGGGATFYFNARGIEEGRYRLTWFVSTNPTFGWSILPIVDNKDLYTKTRRWNTLSAPEVRNGTVVAPATTPGAYFVRVDAADTKSTATYSFVSGGPVVTVER